MDGVSPSRAPSTRRGETPEARDRRREQHYDEVYGWFADRALALDENLDLSQLRAEFDTRVDYIEELSQLKEDSGTDPLDLLRAIADMGGIGPNVRSGLPGEARWLREGTKQLGRRGWTGRVHGIQVFRPRKLDGNGRATQGREFDEILESLQQDPRFDWIDSIDTLIDAIDTAIRAPRPEDTFPGTTELTRAADMDPSTRWWESSWRGPEAEFFQDLEVTPSQETLDAQAEVEALGRQRGQAQARFDRSRSRANREALAAVDEEFAAAIERLEASRAADERRAREEARAARQAERDRQGTLFQGPREDAQAPENHRVSTHISDYPVGTELPYRLPGGNTGTAVLTRRIPNGENWSVRNERGHEVYVSGFRDVTEKYVAPLVEDVLDTGEAQPRLPEAGDVREGDVATPEVADAPFALTPPKGEVGRRGRQDTLFQPFYHGSPHELIGGKFQLARVGTGEGAAAFGWGLYFAENRTVAANYFDMLSQTEIESVRIGKLRLSQRNGWDYSSIAHLSDKDNIHASLAEDVLIDQLAITGMDDTAFRDYVLKLLDARIENYRIEWPEAVAPAQELRRELERPGQLKARFSTVQGGVYTVEIDDNEVAKMLNWDGGLEKQPQAAKDAIRDVLKSLGYLRPKDNGPRVLKSALKAWVNEHGGMLDGPTGQSIYHMFVQEARARLSESARNERRELLARYGAEPGGSFDRGAMSQEDQAAEIRLRDEIIAADEDGPRLASLKLRDLGIPGIVYFDQLSRDLGRGTRNVVVFDENIITLTHKNGTPVTQQERDEFLQPVHRDTERRADTPHRGSIQFSDGSTTINLFETADLSTFLHESGHMFLRVMGDLATEVMRLDPADLTEQQRQFLADVGTTMSFLGVESIEAMSTTRDPQEKWATAFESYLMTGKAPSAELRGAFARFRTWLVGIYRTVKSLVTVPEDVAKVMDRLLASESQIDAAESEGTVAPMFLDAAMAGMAEPEFALYREEVRAASEQARESLATRLMQEVAREQRQEWRSRRREVQADVEASLAQRPEYRALAGIRRGRTPTGEPLVEGFEPEPMLLSFDLLAERFGAERVQKLPKPAIYTREGGLDPETVADYFGFSSADEMITAIENAEPFSRRVRREVGARMLTEHGSILLDGSLVERAQAATVNESRERIIVKEVQALNRLRRKVAPFETRADREATRREQKERAYERRWLEAEARLRIAIAEGRKQVEIDAARAEVRRLKARARGGAVEIREGLPDLQTVRQVAAERIRQMRVRDIRPNIYWSAARRASREATEAAARQDFNAAIAAKNRELLNFALYREAVATRDTVESGARFARSLDRPGVRKAIGKAGGSFLERIDEILARFEFATVPIKRLERRESLENWIKGMESQGIPIDLPDSVLDEARRENWKNLTVDEFSGVVDGLKQLLHLARVKNKLLTAERQRRLDEVTTEIAESIRARNRARTNATIETRHPDAARTRTVGNFLASHRKLASLARELDGFEDGGAFWQAIIRPINAAADREGEMNAEATQAFGDIVKEAYRGRDKRLLYRKQFIPEVGLSLSRMGRIMVAMNWGNAGNRERIRTGYKWTDAQVQAIIDTLDERDVKFVQAVLDQVDSYWTEIAAKQTRVYGVAPEKVEALPIRTRFGVLRGGYFPISYDERQTGQAQNLVDLEQGNLATAAARVQATTRRGHTKERVRSAGKNLRVRLDFGVIFEHVGNVIHDLSHHETLIDVSRVLASPKVQEAIYATKGDLFYRQFKDGLRDIAFGDRPATNGFEKAINHFRVGTTVAMLGWKATTAALQPLGLTQSMVRIGPKWVGLGMVRWLRNPVATVETVRWISEKSTFMRNRARTQQREINEIRNKIGVNTGRLTGWIEEALEHTTLDTVTKQGVADSFFFFIQTMQRVADVPTWLGQYEKSMARGVDEAQAIAEADQAVLDSQGGGQIKDLASVQRGGPLMRLWTNFYSFFNTTYNLTVESTKRARFNKPGSIGRLMVDYMLLYTIPASLGFFLREALRGGEPDDDELIEGLIRENLSFAMGTLLGFRELSGAVSGFYGYEGPAGARFFSSASRTIRQIEQGEADAAFWRALGETTGIATHLPSGQIMLTIEGIVALMEGETEDPVSLLGGPERE